MLKKLTFSNILLFIYSVITLLSARYKHGRYFVAIKLFLIINLLQTLTDSEMDFAKSLADGVRHDSSADFLHIYDVESDENLKHSSSRVLNKKASRAKSIKKEYNYVEIVDGTSCGIIELTGDIQVRPIKKCSRIELKYTSGAYQGGALMTGRNIQG